MNSSYTSFLVKDLDALGRDIKFSDETTNLLIRSAAKRLRELDHQLDEARDCGQEGVCANPPGCRRHWEERNRELVCERDEARKMAHLWRRLYFLMWAGLVDQAVPPDGKPPFPWEDGK